MSKVSVVLTSYNHAQYLRQSIESVLAQTFEDYELIIVDDASTDDSWQIIKTYTDPRIKAIQNPKNMRAKGFYAAIKQATGQYIAIHHSDDVWAKEKLEKQVHYLEENENVGAVFTWAEVIDEEGQIFNDPNHFYGHGIFKQKNRSRFEWLRTFFFEGCSLCHPSLMIRKELYQQCNLFDFGYAQLPDFYKWIKICLQKDIHIIQETLVYFRLMKNEKNASGNLPENNIRTHTEYFSILKLFLKIDSPNDMISVFPEAEKYIVNDQMVVEFALAMMCLQEQTKNLHKLFGLDLLLGLMNNEAKATLIEELYQFDFLDLIKETGKHDVFNLYSEIFKEVVEARAYIIKLHEDIIMKDQYIQKLEKDYVDTQDHIKRLQRYISEKEQDKKELEEEIAEAQNYIQQLKRDLMESGKFRP